MTDTPPLNSSRLSTPTPLALPGLRQLTEVSETESEREPEHAAPESRIIIDAASPTASEEPGGNNNKYENQKNPPC